MFDIFDLLSDLIKNLNAGCVFQTVVCLNKNRFGCGIRGRRNHFFLEKLVGSGQRHFYLKAVEAVDC